MQVVVSDEARDYAHRHGGAVFVSPHAHRCCSGSLTLLDISTVAPSENAPGSATTTGPQDGPVTENGIAVHYRGATSGAPDTLTIELRRLPRQHLVASWDGCAYQL